VPDLLTDITALGAAPVQQVLDRAKVKASEHPYSHFSPDCGPESQAQYLEWAQGRGEGEHAGMERDEYHQTTLETVVQGIVAHRAAHPEWVYTLEQPEGSAMATDPMVLKHLGKPQKLKQCSYGWKHEKATWIWTNLEPKFWKPREWRKGRNLYCASCNAGIQHEERIIRKDANDLRPPAGTSTMPTFCQTARRNRIAPGLGEELANAAMTQWRAKMAQ
jgi:hypothetical protein